jgi:excinuclease ABC subunit A
LPVGLFVCVTGVSGSGKSTLINDTLYHAVARHLYDSAEEPAAYREIEGLEHFDKVISVDQSPIGRTPRSNPATYTGLFTPIRELFAQVKDARERGYGPGRFSFNVKGGRCEACQGDGLIKVEMHFLPDVYVPCDVCHGQRYNRETLEIRYKQKNIHEVLSMTVEQAFAFFEPVPAVARKLATLLDVGLGYITLGNRPPRCPAARRSASSSRSSFRSATPGARCTSSTSRPPVCTSTTSRCCSRCSIACAITATPWSSSSTTSTSSRPPTGSSTSARRAGAGGGTIIAEGPPEAVAANPASYTGHYLKPVLDAEAKRRGVAAAPARSGRGRKASG